MNVNEKPAEELHKPVIKKFKKRKVCVRFKTVFGQQVQLKLDHCLLKIQILDIYCVADVFTKYA